MRRVLIFIPEDYSAGGLQRSAVALRECLSVNGYDATIHCTHLWPGGFAETHSFISAVTPPRRSKLLWWMSYFIEMRRLIRHEKPVAVIGLGLFPSVALPICAYGISSATLIGSERAHPAEVPTGPIFALLRKLMFPRLDYVVCQTTDIAHWFEKSLHIPEERLVVIPNVVRPAPEGWSPSVFEGKEAAASPLFVAVGRLDRQKGFDFALQAFARVTKERPKARLVIIGEGPMQDELLSLRKQLQLEGSVEFRPPASDLTSIWRDAYALLFTSRFEGFPNVLAEAMAHGVPAVAFDCPSGPGDLIHDGRNGFLLPVGDVAAAAERCIRLIDQPSMRDSLGSSAMQVSSRYTLDRIAGLWISLIGRCRQGGC